MNDAAPSDEEPDGPTDGHDASIDSAEPTASAEKESRATDDKAKGETNRIQFKETRYNERGFEETVDAENKAPAPDDKQGLKATHAFVWWQIFGQNKQYSESKAEIKSPALRKLLEDNLRHTPLFVAHSQSIQLSSTDNFDAIIHNWRRLSAVAEATPDGVERRRETSKIRPRAAVESNQSNARAQFVLQKQ